MPGKAAEPHPRARGLRKRAWEEHGVGESRRGASVQWVSLGGHGAVLPNRADSLSPCLSAILLIKADKKPPGLHFEQLVHPGRLASEQHLVWQSICLSCRTPCGVVCLCAPSSGRQRDAGKSTVGLGPWTERAGVTDLPLCSRVTVGQFLDLSESQVPPL